MPNQATTNFDILSWDEMPCEEDNQQPPTISRARVQYRYQGELAGESMSEGPLVYLEDSTASYVGYERFVGSVHGRSGSFVLRADGRFADGVAHTDWEIVAGSGTGELRGIRGTGGYTASEGREGHHARLDYELP